MNIEKLKSEYLPMTETGYYILLALVNERHGYGVMQYVETITNGRIRLGAGTLYGSLLRMEKDSLIEAIAEEKRRKIYKITEQGNALLRLEIARLGELFNNGEKYGGDLHE